VDCLRELGDPGDRRYGHALINCTNCGPRYTIILDLPYDRPLTTMAGFPMCPRCAAEYVDPADRRFHAQPTCCPACGPQPVLVNAEGDAIDPDPVAGAARLLRDGGVIAMKGLGGYHLVVDATDDGAVRDLRRAKRRDHKPFAIMARDIETVASLVRLSDDARCALLSPACPIVLAPRREAVAGAPSIARSVAGGSHRLGVMVPYTPLQHLLFGAGAPDVLVMTSANFADDPLISDDGDARQRLVGVAQALLAHDRPIERAVDDSIVIDTAAGLLPVRRARGYVPTPLVLPVAAPRPGLCTGADLKCAVAVVPGAAAILGQHLGDLGYVLAFKRFRKTVDDLLRLYDVDPAWIACDAHPAYVSNEWARRVAAQRGIELIPVQHHHAHLASLLAEHGRGDRIVGLVCDGVGYGADGAAWGGEVLVGDLAGFTRAGHVRPLRPPGGDAAARETGRCGLSWLVDAVGTAAAEHAAARSIMPDAGRRTVIFDMLERDLNCPPSTGLGRLFDAAAALLGVCDFNHHEAMSGQRLETAASADVRRPSGVGLMPVVERDGVDEIDHRPLLLDMARRRAAGGDAGELAWLFHDAVADGLARAARRAAEKRGLGTVGLTGGVFCNALLTELVASRLRTAGLDVLVHRTVPPNDGGIALGQAAVAAATVAAGK
jgi:hydrogenase maturation protein HypF